MGGRKRKGAFSQIGAVISLLERGERMRLGLVVAGSIFMALIEVAGVGSVMPFMAVAAKPEQIHVYQYLSWAYTRLGFRSDGAFVIFLGVAVLAFLVIANVSQVLLHYAKVKFSSMRRHTLSLRLLKRYLSQPYIFFLNRNSYDLVNNVNNEIGGMITGTLIHFVDFLSRIIQVTLLVLFLFLVNPASTLLIVVAVGGIYGLIYAFVRRTVRRLGRSRFELSAERARVVSEAFWGIKEVKISGTEGIFAQAFVGPSRLAAKNEAISEIIGDLPKFALETAAFSTIIGFVLVSILRSGNFQEVAGSVTLLAYAGYRMIPAAQALFKAVTRLKYGIPTAERMLKEFAATAEGPGFPADPARRLPFSRSIELQGIGFSYPGAEKPTIAGPTLAIGANALVGFAGKTGSGKTTVVDLILGLLRAQDGRILVDGAELGEAELRSWQASLGYVPQTIYLSNDSIAANIAFGAPREGIDMAAVEKAARMAQIHDFIAGDLPEGYATKIGERGIRLSGGQRQRIGIARALYRDPPVLIMDEATSALDHQTEQAVMESIAALQGSRTIILIAHRLSTLRQCDAIHLFEKGKIIASGTFGSLSERSAYFSD